ncbi:hypothetical protein RB594_009009 [Gaeumannomyces avenae]
MEIPSRHRSPPGGLPSMPSIFIGGSSPPRGRGGFGIPSSRPGFSNFSPPLSTSIPMSIPNSRNFNEPPPPLPPPRFVPIDGPTGDHPQYPEPYTRHNPSMSAGSGYGSMVESVKREPGRWPPIKAERDEGYGSFSSMASSSRSQNSIPSRFGPQADRLPWKPSVDAYDNAQLSKLNSHRSLNNRSPTQRPNIGSSLGDSLRHSTTPAPERLQMLKPLSLPTRTKQQPMLESPSRFTETPLTSAASPRSTPFTPLDHRSPMDGGMDFERSPVPRGRRTDSMSVPDDSTVSTQGSYEMTAEDTDFPMEETTRLRGFHIGAADHQGVRPKRKASSPPGGDEPYSIPSSNDMLRRREGGASRGSPTPRLTMLPHGSSMSSVGGRSGSMVSNLSLQVSSLSSQGMFNGAGRLSPGGMSAGGLSPTDQSSCGSPFGTPMSLTASPRSSISRTTPHNRTLSDQNRQPLASPHKLSEVVAKPSTAVSKIKGFYMCECCPKKPKKFETKEDLSAHELEKQYECSFCGNRFKNKNEAERHQNSLHVRRHSWSCSALSGWDRTFHESTTQPGRADVCGYCGKEFARSGPPGSASGAQGAAAGNAWVATEQDWEERHRHLTDAHKYRECNASKKFYRADHFRQHLKHSHAGTSGKWTNMLENACMIEEEPPVPMVR